MAYRYLVVIPAYNEAASIEQVVQLSRQYADVCVVDDASTDATPQILSRLAGVHIIHHTKNTHIPGAILDGMRYALEAGYDFCITLDAGMSHDPTVLAKFKEHTEADLVIGYRARRVKVPAYRKALSYVAKLVMNHALNRKARLGNRSALKDVTSGYRMYSRRSLALLLRTKMKSRSFDFHLEALAHIYRNDLKIEEIPISYIYSNSSLRWRVVGHALKTWWRIYRGTDSAAVAGI